MNEKKKKFTRAEICHCKLTLRHIWLCATGLFRGLGGGVKNRGKQLNRPVLVALLHISPLSMVGSFLPQITRLVQARPRESLQQENQTSVILFSLYLILEMTGGGRFVVFVHKPVSTFSLCVCVCVLIVEM